MAFRLRLPPFARTTTFQLALLYTVALVIFSAGLLIFLYAATVGYMQGQADRRVEAELSSLLEAYRQGGITRLENSIRDRASTDPRTYYYQLTEPSGRKISGDFAQMPAYPTGPGITSVGFTLSGRRTDGSAFELQADGRIAPVGEEAVLMVAYDASELSELIDRITEAVYLAAPIGLALSLIGGITISRYAARRADELATTAEAVMAGDLGRRAARTRRGDEFDRLAERLNAMLDRLERLVLASRHAGDAVAHDLQSPLSRMRNQLEAALAKPLTAETAKDEIADTLVELDGVLATFKAILRLARLDAGTDGRLAPTDVSALAGELVDLFEPACEAEGLDFSAHIHRGLSAIGDRELIAQAVSNLIDNAIKYTPRGGAIRFEARKGSDASIDLVVLDTGPGIPEHERGNAVKRFVRGDSARTQPGSGLGLALVDAVAHLHKGDLDLLDGNGPPERPGLKAILHLPRA